MRNSISAKHDVTDVQHAAAPEAVSPSVASPEAVRAQAERILASPLFQTSQRYSNLLKFIVDRSLKGQNKDLKERIIGIEVFGRSPDYDTSIDPTVRVAVNEVRKRLAQYYSKTANQQELRIAVPIGSYLAEFKVPEPSPSPPELVTEPVPVRGTLFSRWHLRLAATAVLVALSVWAAIRIFVPVPVIDKFWAPVLNSPGPVLICIGARAGTISGHQTSANETDAKAGESPGNAFDEQVIVGTFDTNAAEDLAAYLRRKGKDSQVFPTPDIKLTDSKFESLVSYGRLRNERAASLGADLHFRFRTDPDLGLRWIEDPDKPASKDWSVALSVPDVRINHDYALISRIQDPTNGRWWIGIAGLTGLGTSAANQMVIDSSAMSSIGASLPRGWERKNLQVVLETTTVHGRSGVTRVVKTYSW